MKKGIFGNFGKAGAAVMVAAVAALFALTLFTGCEQSAGSTQEQLEQQEAVITVLPGNQRLSVSWSYFSGIRVFAGTGDEMPDKSEGNATIDGDSAVITGLTNNVAYNVWVVGYADEYIKTSEKAIPVNICIPAGKFAGSEYIYEFDGVTYTKYQNNGFNAPSGIIYTGTIVFADANGAIIIKTSESAYRAVKVSYENKLYKVAEAAEAPEIPANVNGTITASFGDAYTANIVVGKLVTFDSNGGNTEASPAAVAVEAYKNIGRLPVPPEKIIFQFSGWKKTDGSAFTAETVVDSNITVYAQWTAETGGTRTFASMADMAYYLENFFGDNSAENPIEIVLTGAISIEDLKTDNDNLGAVFEAFNGKYVKLDMSAVTGTEIADSIQTIERIRADKDKLVSIKLPASLTKIGNYSFIGCTSLESVEFPDALTNLGQGAFSGCASLSTAALPSGVTEILANTFEGCASLDVDTAFFANIEKIGASAFKGSGITSFTIPQKITQLGANAFENCAELVSVDLSALGESSLNTVGHYMFTGCSKLNSLTLPATGIATIGTSTFSGCSSLVSVTLPSTLKGTVGTGPIGVSTFENCTNLETVTWTALAEDATNIRLGGQLGKTFKGCTSLKTFTVPEGITLFVATAANGSSPFHGCTSLTSITLSKTLTQIQQYIFTGCTNLSEINILKPSSDGLITLANVNAFTGTLIDSRTAQNTHIYVPDEASVTAYKAATNWSNFAELISVKPADQGE